MLSSTVVARETSEPPPAGGPTPRPRLALRDQAADDSERLAKRERHAAIERQNADRRAFAEAKAAAQRDWDPAAFRRLVAEHCPALAKRLERERPLSEPGHQPRPPPTV